MEFKDYYQILNIEKTATLPGIETAYQNLLKIYETNHTDQDVQAHLQEINEAHQALTDPERRAKYDQLETAWRLHQKSDNAAGFDWAKWVAAAPSDDAPDNGQSEFYRAIFAAIGPPPAPAGTPQDYNQEVEISLEEAYTGVSRILRLGNRRIEVRIPKGARTGTKIRVRGEGGTSQEDGPKGDLYLNVKVIPHPVFQWLDDDLNLELPLNLYTAVLGGEAIVPMLKGKLKLKIPPETQSGRVFRLKGHGMPRLKQPDERGDLFARVAIQIPQNLNDEEIALFEELADIRGL
jgi:curved DNA-binding protein